MNILLVIDMQNDFIDGSLGTREAERIVPLVQQKITGFNGRIIFTRDTHERNYLDTQEGLNLPVMHCLKGTRGWELNEVLKAYCHEEPVDKPTFGSVALAERLREENVNEPIESITLVGLCTDICVISNAILLKAYLPEVKLLVDAACCAGVTPQTHENALAAMRMCQIEIINQETEQA